MTIINTIIATLGPKGTFSHEAVLRYNKNAEIFFKKTIADVFEAVEQGEVGLGIAPLENSIAGSVGATLDCLMEFDLKIIDEEIVPIKHNLAGFGALKDIGVIYAHPQSYAQCEKFLRKHLPNAEIIETSSNGKSAELLANKTNNKKNAAIVPAIAAKIYKLKILNDDIQNNKFNTTRFIAISKIANHKTGYDRTSIAISPQLDKPGLLYNMLGEFAKRKINLTKIESRPSKGKLGDYIFYIDLQGHKEEINVANALKEIEKSFFLKILGSYPRKY